MKKFMVFFEVSDDSKVFYACVLDSVELCRMDLTKMNRLFKLNKNIPLDFGVCPKIILFKSIY